jgi:hypothetical protein
MTCKLNQLKGVITATGMTFVRTPRALCHDQDPKYAKYAF